MCARAHFYEDAGTARAWARWMLAQPHLAILDTETTGLKVGCEVVSVAAVDRDGATLLDLRVRPVYPVPLETMRYHGIRNLDLAFAPSFAEVYPQIAGLFRTHVVVIYNAEYDVNRLTDSARLHGLPRFELRPFRCAMEAYAAYWGNWSDYFQSYKWQKLAVAAERMGYTYHEHIALEDCRATLAVMRGMVEGRGL
jgi:DNA polymerase-3 subunit epsilon